MKTFDIIIIGGGPSGISCALEAKKAGLSHIILEKGFLVNSIFNFPVNMTFFSTSLKLEIGEIPFISHNDKPTRQEALEYYRRLASYYELDIAYQTTVLEANKVGNRFIILTTKGEYHAKNIVIATGYYDKPRMLHIAGEDLPKVKHYYDDAHIYIGRKVLVIGGANSACDVALETWGKGAEVTMVVRESELYKNVKYWILPNIQNRIKEGQIKAYFQSQVLNINQHSVTISTPTSEFELENDYVLAMTGYMPDYDLLEKLGLTFTTDDQKVPIFDESTLCTPTKGLYVAGVINAGMATSSLFIENTRHHGQTIVNHILKK